MADNNLEALAYPTTRRKANLIAQPAPIANLLPILAFRLSAFRADYVRWAAGRRGAARAYMERATTYQARLFLRAGNASPTTTGYRPVAGPLNKSLLITRESPPALPGWQ
jgi:hypothetical protein